MSTRAPEAPAKGSGPVLLTLAAGQFLMTLDSSVMNVSIATVAKDVGAPRDRSPVMDRAPDAKSGDCPRLMSVPVSVHQPALDRTQATWLDSTPDLSCINSTQAYCVDGEHQPTDLAVGRSNPSRLASLGHA